MPRVSTALPVVALLALNALGFFLANGGDQGPLVDSSWRVVVGGILVALAPGLLAGEAWGLKARHPLEALSRAFGISLLLGLALALAAFWLRAGIGWWVGGVLAWNAGWGVCALASPRPRGLLRDGLSVLARSRSDQALALGLALLGLLALRWADRVTGVEWETALHLTYARQYGSGLPLDFRATALRPELALPNLLFLWEFLLAGISRLSGVDTLVGSLRARWLIPVLGLAAMFDFSLQLTRSVYRARVVTWVVLLAVASQLFLLPPHPLMTAGAIDMPDRWITAFLGSIHHSDTAMEILLPLLCAALLLFLRSGRPQHLLYLTGLLAAAFFWHPREYFQLMWYGAVVGGLFVLVGPPRGRRQPWRVLALALMFVALAAVLLGLANLLTGADHLERNNEWAAKLDLAASLLDPQASFAWEPPFRFSIHQFLGVPASPPNMFTWLVLATLLAPALVLGAKRRSLYPLLILLTLWFSSLCFKWTQVLLLLLTYSEMLAAKFRVLPLFAYVTLGLAWLEAIRWWAALRGGAWATRQVLETLGLAATGGLVFSILWLRQAPDFTASIWVLNGVLALVVLGVALRFVGYPGWLRDLPSLRRWLPGRSRRVGLPLIVGSWAAFLVVPTLLSLDRIVFALTYRADLDSLVTREGPLGLSASMMERLRTLVRPRSRVLVNPRGRHMLGIYAPLYVVPLPRGNVWTLDGDRRQAASEGRDPLFNPRTAAGQLPRADDAAHQLELLEPDYVLASPPYAEALERWAETERFLEVLYLSEEGELLLEVAPGRAPAAPSLPGE